MIFCKQNVKCHIYVELPSYQNFHVALKLSYFIDKQILTNLSVPGEIGPRNFSYYNIQDFGYEETAFNSLILAKFYKVC